MAVHLDRPPLDDEHRLEHPEGHVRRGRRREIDLRVCPGHGGEYSRTNGDHASTDTRNVQVCEEPKTMSTLLIDNHDSNTFNLFQLLAVIEGREPVVVRNDEADWAALRAERFSRCVISAGPGRPDRPRDFGLSRSALAQVELPVLGVCLGHQGLVLAHGGEVGAAPRPMHGRRSRIYHEDSELFRGIPQGFLAVRYHSLSVHEPLPATLEVIARTASGTVMAVRHRERPHWGVQFHPESVQTEWGERLLENFCRMTRRAGARRGLAGRAVLASPSPPPPQPPRAVRSGAGGRTLELVVRSVRRPPDAETAFVRLFGAETNAFWLDSSRHGPGLARFSYMGAGGGPRSALVSHDVAAGQLTLHRRGSREIHRGGLLDWLDRSLAEISLEDRGLPFDFTGGFVGYLGYELKGECGSPLVHRSPHPDAMLLFADRLIAYDHAADEAHVVCLTEAGARGEAARWADETARRLRSLRAEAAPRPAAPGERTTFSLIRSADGYLRDIETCQEYLAAGESYEICLTNELAGPRCADALNLHRVLRRVNPAPFAAFLRLGGVEVLSSSPERFLALDRSGGLEAKPIKGTVARGATPREDREAAARLRSDAKDRAENLMIVDVLRNDLGRVAEVGSVSVPKLMGVESYETVHQLVSTVRARLRSGATIVDCLRASFPGGSMTGAPKLRTMEIIDSLETRPRGIYAGAIGYLAANGSADLSIAIRTIVNSSHGMTIGAGGAITVQSDAGAELRELLLKARAPLDAVGLALHGRRDGARVADGDPATLESAAALSGHTRL
jgi:para-aminobenzoate synthetase